MGENGGNYAAIDDLAAAVSYITEHAGEFQVEASDYALLGYSAGGDLVGLFGTETLGYAKYNGIEKPSMIMMGYPWYKVNFDTGVIVIDCNLLYSASKGIYEDTTKTGVVRAIKIAPQTLAVLRQWRTEYERLQELNGDRWAGTPYVFVRDDGSWMHPDSITAWLNRFSAQNDLPHIHPHAFRHTAASTMIANGVDLVTTAAELGHANANTTATIYAHQIAIARATAADVRAGVFAGRK